MNDPEVFSGKKFSDLLKDIHDATIHKRTRIDEMIITLRKLIREPESAVTVAPIIASFIEVMVKNDEHLVKIAAIVQRIIAASSKNSDSLDALIPEEEKEKMMEDARAQLAEALTEYETKKMGDGIGEGA